MITFTNPAVSIPYIEDGFSVTSPAGVWNKSNAEANMVGTVSQLFGTQNGGARTLMVKRSDAGSFSFSGVDLAAGPEAGEVVGDLVFKYRIIGTLNGSTVFDREADLPTIPVAGTLRWEHVNPGTAEFIDSLSITIFTAKSSANTVGYGIKNIDVVSAAV